MKFYFDENFPPSLARGLREFEAGRSKERVEVIHMTEEFGKGSPDEEWIPQVAQKHAVVITQDKNIHRVRAQAELCKIHKLGIVFLRPPKRTNYSYWEIIGEIVKHWAEIKQVAREVKKPFSFDIKPRSNHLSKL